MQGDTCVKNRIGTDYSTIIENAEAVGKSSDLKSMLNYIETELSKTLAPEKVENAMKLLRSLENSEDEKSAGVSEDRFN